MKANYKKGIPYPLIGTDHAGTCKQCLHNHGCGQKHEENMPERCGRYRPIIGRSKKCQ